MNNNIETLINYDNYNLSHCVWTITVKKISKATVKSLFLRTYSTAKKYYLEYCIGPNDFTIVK